jgi:uncharacterized cupredoxin-like copper-binding protein
MPVCHQSTMTEAALPVGVYRFICPVSDHAQLGMTTSVTVTP